MRTNRERLFGRSMESSSNSDNLLIVASHAEPIYRELESPYLEVCAILRNGLIQGYKHYAESWPGLVAHPEALSEIIILLRARPFFNNKRQVGLIHYRRIFSLNPHEYNDQNHTQDLRTRFSRACIEAQFLQNYEGKIVIPKPLDVNSSVLAHFIEWHAPLENALDEACLVFNASVQNIFGIIDSKSELENTQYLYAWNMWIGSPDFYDEWVTLLLPVLKALDDMSSSLPNDGYQFRWSGFISERLFSVYINLCKKTNRWNFVERPVIFFEDSAVAERDNVLAERDNVLAERDSAIAERDSVLKSKSWTVTSFLRSGDKILRMLFSTRKQ